MRELLIMRHGKSDWNGGMADFERPLAPRGIRDAEAVGAWLTQSDLWPDRIRSSPAARTRETVSHVLQGAGREQPEPEWLDTMYLASLDTLLAAIPEAMSGRLLLVGHNPGLDQLVMHLCGPQVSRSLSGKLMTTAALAHLRLAEGEQMHQAGSAELLNLRRPREV